MIYSFEILDAHVESLKAFLNTQLDAVVDPVTKAQRLQPKYPGGVQEFLVFQMTNLIESIVKQFPDDETRAELQAALDASNAMRARFAPKILTDAQVAARMGGPTG